MTALDGRLRATLLPSGESRELWIRDGTLRFEGPSSARELVSPGGFAISGLVDAHAHLSWPHHRDMPSHTLAFMDRIRQVYAELGTTALRDMGSDRDEVCRLPDAPGLPPFVTAGTMLLRDDTWPLTDTPPSRLVAAVKDRISAGARWIKVFSDFSSDFQGREHPGFSGDDALTYPLEVLSEAVAVAHAAQLRVAVHCYSYEGAKVAIEAGADSLEHGWGVDEALVRRMAAQGVAWVPLAGIAGKMVAQAREHAEPGKSEWIDERLSALQRLLPLAADLGVTILAGTDWFPDPSVGDEVIELHELGLTKTQALAAGSWTARAYLGFPGLETGARADLVLLRDDPRIELETLLRPELVVVGGVRVTPRPEWHLAPNRLRWSRGVPVGAASDRKGQ